MAANLNIAALPDRAGVPSVLAGGAAAQTLQTLRGTVAHVRRLAA
jgi:hypothetical protein